MATDATNQTAYETILLTPEETAQQLRISRSRVYELLRAGEILSVAIGTSRRVPNTALRNYVDGLLAAQLGE